MSGWDDWIRARERGEFRTTPPELRDPGSYRRGSPGIRPGYRVIPRPVPRNKPRSNPYQDRLRDSWRDGLRRERE